MQNEENMIVTPWTVSGKIDYSRLIEEFGTEPLTKNLLERIKKHAGIIHLQSSEGDCFFHIET
jgi:tryptophanyl-tRNA synthetase